MVLTGLIAVLCPDPSWQDDSFVAGEMVGRVVGVLFVIGLVVWAIQQNRNKPKPPELPPPLPPDS